MQPKIKITLKSLTAEVKRLSGHAYDPGYISAIRCGNRKSDEVLTWIEKATATLTAKVSIKAKSQEKGV